MMQALICPNCGATLPSNTAHADVVTCEFCGTTFRPSDSGAPEPTLGNLLLAADFSKKPIAGWGILHEDNVTLVPGDRPELQAKLEPKSGLYDILSSAGMFDNFDFGVSIKFIEGSTEWIRAGLFARYGDDGGYGFLISAQGTYKLGYYAKGADDKIEWKDLMSWTTHAALRSGLNQANRLRVTLNKDRMRVYLNGVLATAIRDTHFDVGKLYLSVEPTQESSVLVAFSDVQLREVPS